jgi:hypothetical protein
VASSSRIAFLEDAKRKAINLSAKQNHYTPIQQFFLAHGQGWCGAIRPEQVRLQVQTDPHSPRQFRIDGVIQNMPECVRPCVGEGLIIRMALSVDGVAVAGTSRDMWRPGRPSIKVSELLASENESPPHLLHFRCNGQLTLCASA